MPSSRELAGNFPQSSPLVPRQFRILLLVLAPGLSGWLSIEVGLLRLDGVGLRQTKDGGRLYLAFPEPTDRRGRRREIVRPRDAAARREIEREVLAALNLGGGDDQ